MWRFAQFDGRSSELCFESIVILEHSPADAAKLDPLEATWTFPVAYSAEEKPDLADCIQRRYPDPDNEVERWTRQFLHLVGQSALWNSSAVFQRISINAFFTDGGKPRGFSYRTKRCDPATAVAETSLC
jgi:hypothetical protein